ncbi:MAG: hypothetical protein ACRDOO_28540 [Actinomadura sp.]
MAADPADPSGLDVRDLSASPLVVGKDMVTDRNGAVLAAVRRPRVFPLLGWLRWSLWRHRARSFDLCGTAGDILFHVDEGGVTVGRFHLAVQTGHGDLIGTVTAMRTGMRSVIYVFTDANGALLGEGRLTTKVRYGDIPKKFTYAFTDHSGSRVATADQKPGGDPRRFRFQNQISGSYRLLIMCFLIVLPGGRIASRPAVDDGVPEAVATGGLVGAATMELRRDQVVAPDGQLLATVREPYVPALRGVSRALSHNPGTTSHRLEITGPGGEPLFTVDKSSGALWYDVDVGLPDGTIVGAVKRSRGVAKPTYLATDAQRSTVATIVSTEAFSGDYSAADPEGTQQAVINRVLAVDEPWHIRFTPGSTEHFRMLVIAFVVVQELMLDL